ncbi:uncharacterized protein J3D65DRAFT_439680 [Phyllosticta citribraziliensis]|uniref:Secreted protein n=1 Tax=Phyllosticta citribraziliensis TaxID=989973 RepID=A0ABR1LKP7_9PEZI
MGETYRVNLVFRLHSRLRSLCLAYLSIISSHSSQQALTGRRLKTAWYIAMQRRFFCNQRLSTYHSSNIGAVASEGTATHCIAAPFCLGSTQRHKRGSRDTVVESCAGDTYYQRPAYDGLVLRRPRCCRQMDQRRGICFWSISHWVSKNVTPQVLLP